MKRALLLMLFGIAGYGGEPSVGEKFAAIFAPSKSGNAVLSPDGRRLAYSFRERESVYLGVLDLDEAVLKASVLVGTDERRRTIEGWYVRRPGVRKISWVSAERIVFETSDREIAALDWDGKNVVSLVGSRSIDWYVRSRTLEADPPLGFSNQRAFRRPVRVVAVPPQDPTSVYLEAGGPPIAGVITGEEEISLLKVDVRTGRSTLIGSEPINGRVIYDLDGRPRVYASYGETPHRFYLRSDVGSGRKWELLDKRTTGGPEQFGISPEGLFGQRSIPLGFAFDPNVLYVASNVGRDLYGVYGLNLTTGLRTGQAIEHPEFDFTDPAAQFLVSPLVVDRHRQTLAGLRLRDYKSTTIWFDPELAKVQAGIEARLAGHNVHLLGWSERRDRFLIHSFHRADPGSYLVYFPAENRLSSYLPIGAAIQGGARIVSSSWARRIGDRLLTGNLTRHAEARMRPTPVVVYLSSSLWGRAVPDYSTVVHALAEMGFAVLEISTRGTSGLGVQHWVEGKERLDRVVAEDVISALDSIPPELELDSRLVAAMGFDFGGYLALRLMQLIPERMRCAVAIDPVTDLAAWLKGQPDHDLWYRQRKASYRWFFGNDEERLKDQSPSTHAAYLAKPVLLASTRNYGSTPGFELKKLRSAARPAPTFVGLARESDGIADLSHLFGKIERFLTDVKAR